ncbi:RING finger protein 222 [Macaca fascicularis]|uniref:RING finger protein 222 n=1 Tax=Macaca fascicularis TaxID=9541 RepID=G7PTL3_MACFA|nr:RING finger protein 222 [Macaca fascicularis]
MSEGESKDSSGSECPVCYEKFRDLEGASRTLSCGHVFCHDCLVKYLLSTRVDGQVQRILVCPICRYVTFFSKKSSRWPSMLDKSSQTLTVPVALPSVPPLDSLGHTNPLAASSSAWRPPPGQARSPGSPGQSAQLPLDLLPSLPRESQVFASPAPRSARAFCCRSRALLLITLIAVVAVVAAILPWVLLVRKQA